MQLQDPSSVRSEGWRVGGGAGEGGEGGEGGEH